MGAVGGLGEPQFLTFRRAARAATRWEQPLSSLLVSSKCQDEVEDELLNSVQMHHMKQLAFMVQFFWEY